MKIFSKMKSAVAVGASSLLVPALAFAGGSMPWDGPIHNIQTDLSGPVAGAFVTIAIVATGLMWGFGEHGSSMRKVAGIAAGGSMALGGATVVSDITGQSATSGAVLGQVAAMQIPADITGGLLAGGLALFAIAAAVAIRAARKDKAVPVVEAA